MPGSSPGSTESASAVGTFRGPFAPPDPRRVKAAAAAEAAQVAADDAAERLLRSVFHVAAGQLGVLAFDHRAGRFLRLANWLDDCSGDELMRACSGVPPHTTAMRAAAAAGRHIPALWELRDWAHDTGEQFLAPDILIQFQDLKESVVYLLWQVEHSKLITWRRL